MEDFAAKDKFVAGFESGGVSPNGHVSTSAEMQNENIDAEVAPAHINLKSFIPKGELPPKIWDGDKLDSRVRLKLMDIADDFWQTVKVSWVKPEGLVLTGSICNYNWSSYSDIDLHLVVDFSKVHERKDFVQEYFNGKKNDWNNSHVDLELFGYNVELYIQDINDEVESGGIYDLYGDRWLSVPEKGKFEPITDAKHRIKVLAAGIMSTIDNMCDAFDETDDKHIQQEIGDACDELQDEISKLRKLGLEDGEMGEGNIIYKVLRRSEYLDKLWKLKTEIYDSVNSIDENVSFEDRLNSILR